MAPRPLSHACAIAWSMHYRRFGRTGLELPVLTCGGMRFQQSWTHGTEITPGSQRNLEELIEKALSLGIHHIETARGYGTSERQLGRILPSLPRDEIVVQTKVSPTPDPADFRANVDRSFRAPEPRAGGPVRDPRRQRRRPPRLDPAEGGLPGCRDGDAARGALPLPRLLDPRPRPDHPGVLRGRTVRLREPPLLLRVPAPSGAGGGGGPPRHGRLHHQPHEQGRPAGPAEREAPGAHGAVLPDRVQRPLDPWPSPGSTR